MVCYIEASAKLKIKKRSECGSGSRIRIEKNDHSHKLPYNGGILNAKGEYIPGTKHTLPWCISNILSFMTYRK